MTDEDAIVEREAGLHKALTRVTSVGLASSPLEAIPEILEQLHGREPELVGELLAELAKADIATLAKLFGYAPPDELPAVESAPLEPEPDRVVWSKPGAPEPEPRGPVWDDTGRRIWPPHRSMFLGKPRSPAARIGAGELMRLN